MYSGLRTYPLVFLSTTQTFNAISLVELSGIFILKFFFNSWFKSFIEDIFYLLLRIEMIAVLTRDFASSDVGAIPAYELYELSESS